MKMQMRNVSKRQQHDQRAKTAKATNWSSSQRENLAPAVFTLSITIHLLILINCC